MIRKRNSGFTLVELLVVISIISVLSALLMVNFIGIRQRGRDGQRKSNLRQIQSALELYRTDAGIYPTTSQLPPCGSALLVGSTTYMQKVPCDPLTNLGYSYTSDGSSYILYACLENTNDSEKDSSPRSGCAISFTVNNP